MKPILILTAFLIGLPAFGQSTWRNFFTTNQNPIVEVVAGSNATVQASTVGVNLRRFTVNGTGSGSGSGQTNWPVSSITNAGTAAYSNASAFYLNSNPSNYITAAQQRTNWPWQNITNISSVQIPQAAITNQTPHVIQFSLDTTGGAIQSGTRGTTRISFTGTITSSTLMAYPSGSIEVQLWRTNSADASYPPTRAGSIGTNALTSDSYNIDSTLTGWTTLVTTGDVFTVNVQTNALSVTNLTWIMVVQP